MLDCFITSLFGHLHITLMGVGGNPQYIVGDEGVKHSTVGWFYITEGNWLRRLSDWRIWWVEL
jgi:hypothetical protein